MLQRESAQRQGDAIHGAGAYCSHRVLNHVAHAADQIKQEDQRKTDCRGGHCGSQHTACRAEHQDAANGQREQGQRPDEQEVCSELRAEIACQPIRIAGGTDDRHGFDQEHVVESREKQHAREANRERAIGFLAEPAREEDIEQETAA